jgi:hypothetical protein
LVGYAHVLLYLDDCSAASLKLMLVLVLVLLLLTLLLVRSSLQQHNMAAHSILRSDFAAAVVTLYEAAAIVVTGHCYRERQPLHYLLQAACCATSASAAK